MRFGTVVALSLLVTTAACNRLKAVGAPPEMSPPQASAEAAAMRTYGLQNDFGVAEPIATTASLWTGERGSLLGDSRAVQRGDILTVVIEIDDSASISNSTDRSRSGSESLSIPNLFGIPQRADESLPEGASLSTAVDFNSNSNFGGDGSVRRNEQLELKSRMTNLPPRAFLMAAEARSRTCNSHASANRSLTSYCLSRRPT